MSQDPEKSRKRPGRWRRWVVRPVTWGLTLALASAGLLLIYLSSPAMVERLRVFAVARLSETLGRPVVLGGLELGLLPLSLELRDVEIPGPTPEAPPFARLPRVRVDLSLTGWARPVLTIRRLWLERPEVFLEVAADGRLNLPRLVSGQSGGELVVRLGELSVEQGVFRLNELSLPLSIDAHGVEVLAHGLPGEHPNSGSVGLEARLSIDRALTTLPDGSSYPVRVTGGARVLPGRVEILDTALSGSSLAAQVSGTYRFEGMEQRLQLDLKATGDLGLVAALGAMEPGQVEGPFRYAGELYWNAGPWLLTGKVKSAEIKAGRHRLLEVEADVKGAGSELTFELRRARYAEGSLSGPIHVALGQRPATVATELSLEGLATRQVLADLGLDLPMLGGRLAGTARYTLAVDAPFNGVGEARLKIEGSEIDGNERILPLSGGFTLTVADGRLEAPELRLLAPDQEIRLLDLGIDLKSGAGGLGFAVETLDAGRLAAVLPLEAPEGPLPLWLPTAGRGQLAGDLRWGSRAGVEANVSLALSQVELAGKVAGDLTGGMLFSQAAIESLDLRLERGQGNVAIRGRVPFEEGREILALTFEAADWPYSHAKAFAPVELPIDGPLTGRLELVGPAEHLSGRLEANLQPVVVAGIEARSLASRLRFDEQRVSVERLELVLPAGHLRGQGDIELGAETTFDLRLESAALNLQAAPFATYLGGHLQGSGELQAQFRGSFAAPRGELALSIPVLRLNGVELGRGEVKLLLERGNATLAAELPGLLQAHGGGMLELGLEGSTPAAASESGASGGRIDLALAVESRELANLVEAVAGERLADLQGAFAGQLKLQGALGSPDVSLTLDSLSGSFQGLELVNLEPVLARLNQTGIDLVSLYLGNRVEGDPAEGTEVFVGGEISLAEGTPLDLHLQGSLPARWLEPFLPSIKLGGTINALGVIRGTAREIALDGQADLTDSRLVLTGFPHVLEELSAVALIYPDQVVLDRLDARLAGGAVKAAGSFALGETPFSSYHFQAQARDMALRYPEGWAIEGSANLAFDPLADGSGSLISGRAVLSRAAYQRDLEANLFQLLQGYLRRQPVVMETVDTALSRTQLAVEVDAPGTLRVNNNVADLRGTAALRLRGNLARPALQGKVEIERGGTLAFDESEYNLERGLLTFSRFDRIDPDIDLVARTQVSEYEITLKLSGNMENLKTSFSSEPPLPNLDVLALLATGDRPAAGGTLATTGAGNPLDSGSVESLLIDTAGRAVTDRVKKLLRFDKLRIDPTAATGGSVNAARLLVGKQISRDLYVTYQQSLSSSDQNLVQAEWRLAPGLVVVLSSVAEKDLNRQFSIDLRWEKRF